MDPIAAREAAIQAGIRAHERSDENWMHPDDALRAALVAAVLAYADIIAEEANT